MPGDGKTMVPCSSCKNWFHGSCDRGEFDDPQWTCIACQKKKRALTIFNDKGSKKIKEELKRQRQVFTVLRKAAAKGNNTEIIVKVYNCINNTILKRRLPVGENTLGDLSTVDYKKITGCRDVLLGITHYDRLTEDLFIVIFTNQHI